MVNEKKRWIPNFFCPSFSNWDYPSSNTAKFTLSLTLKNSSCLSPNQPWTYKLLFTQMPQNNNSQLQLESNRPDGQSHRMFGVGRDLCGSSSPTPLPKQGHLQQAPQDNSTRVIRTISPAGVRWWLLQTHQVKSLCAHFSDLPKAIWIPQKKKNSLVQIQHCQRRPTCWGDPCCYWS